MKRHPVIVLATTILALQPSANLYAATALQTARTIQDRSGQGFLKILSEEEAANEQTFSLEDLLSNIDNFVKTPPNGLSWQVLGSTGQTPYSHTDKDGLEWSGVRPAFPETLRKLDGQTILLQGYMFPLEPSEGQSTFLFGPFPISCPFHYHVTPNLIVEVYAKKPVKFQYDVMNIQGRLELVEKDDENNVFFRLKDAIAVKPDKGESW